MTVGRTILDRKPRLRRSAPPRRPTFRRDVQGLRAVAVLFVIADHLFGWPHGGFVGVDIFFVISGFLITGLLIREFELTGKISFSNFYKRRVKRILPASALVLVVTVGASFLLLNATRAWSVFWDGVWATLFVANWRFASSGTDYFQADGPVSPLQHFWSLAVEEQYYFVWPWVMLAVLAIVARKSHRHARLAAGIAIALISAASFAWALLETQTSPTVAYFSTITRTWELGFGALLAIASPLLLQIPHVLRPIIAWAGIVIMIWSLFFVSEGPAFPAPAAAIPVLGVSLVLLAGVGGDQRFLAPLTNRVSGYIGNISYSLYLWHFPVIVLVLPLLPFGSAWNEVASLLIIGAVSIAAYHMWEDTLRRSPWLDGKGAWVGYKLPSWWKYAGIATMAAGSAVLVAIAMTVVSPRGATTVAQPVLAAGGLASAEGPEVSYGPAVTALQGELARALATTSWPETTPSIDSAIGSAQSTTETSGCVSMNTTLSIEACTFGNPEAQKHAYLVGDSIAVTYAGPLIAALSETHRITVRAAYGCAFTAEAIGQAGSSELDDCTAHNAATVEAANSDQPDEIFVAHTYEPRTRASDGQQFTASELASTVLAQTAKVSTSQPIVVGLSPAPASSDITSCYGPLTDPAECVSYTSGLWEQRLTADTDAFGGVGGKTLDLRPLYCVDGVCPAFAGGVPMKSDLVHITVPYGEHITPGFKELLLSAGV